MRSDRDLIVVCCVLSVALLVACGPGGPKVDPAVEAEWTWLTESKEKLDGLRAELAGVQKALQTADPETSGEEGEAGGETVEAMTAKAETLEGEVANLTDEFGTRLVTFLNDPSNQMIEGEPLTERQSAAIRMKSSEDIALAAEYIEKGGDYRRAIDILTTSLQLDPDNTKVQAALETATSNRYMSEERFAGVKKGMSQTEVREVLGQVNLRNIREYPDRNVVAWFYATAEGGAAAAVWFREDKKSGERVAYQIKYDAVEGAGGG